MRFRPILMTGLAFVCGVLPMVIATGAGGASQQALGTSVMGGMIAVVILALLMVPVFFVTVQRTLAGDREKVEEEGRGCERRTRAGGNSARSSGRCAPAYAASYLPSGFKIFISSACTNSLPHTTSPVFSASSWPSMPEMRPPDSRTMIWPAAMSQGCRLRSQ